MASTEHVNILCAGALRWNEWREQNPEITPDLSDIEFGKAFSEVDSLTDYEKNYPSFEGYNFSSTNLNRVNAAGTLFDNCDFSHCHFHFSYLCSAIFQGCNFLGASLAVSKIGSTSFLYCNFTETDLSYCSAEETDFSGSTIHQSNMSNMSLVKTDFSDAKIDRTRVYGISAWDLNLKNCQQNEIYIKENGTMVSVPSIEMAQFIALLISNTKIRDIIDTITSKAVLILGRFSDNRKPVLDQLKNELQKRNYVPILFDFQGPSSRDLTETISTLAMLSRFVIADLSNAKSVPQELQAIVPNYPSLPVQPIIERGLTVYSMFEHFERYPWVKKVIYYSGQELKATVDEILDNLDGNSSKN